MVALDDWTVDSKLTDEDKLQCSQIVESYLAGRLKDPVMAGACTTQTFNSSIAHTYFRLAVLVSCQEPKEAN